MNAAFPPREVPSRASRALLSLFDVLGLPNPDDPLGPGPWDPVIRDLDLAVVLGDLDLRRVRAGAWEPSAAWVQAVDPFGSLGTPWRAAIVEVIRRADPRSRPAFDGWSRVALNPQPLPPRWAFVSAVASGAVRRAELVAQAGGDGGAVLSPWEGDTTPPGPWTPPGPNDWPWPRAEGRPDWLVGGIWPADLAVMASVHAAASLRVADPRLSAALDASASRLVEAVGNGLS